jgi:hypothetical protein
VNVGDNAGEKQAPDFQRNLICESNRERSGYKFSAGELNFPSLHGKWKREQSTEGHAQVTHITAATALRTSQRHPENDKLH